jgi:ribose transport system substrate-binding protein
MKRIGLVALYAIAALLFFGSAYAVRQRQKASGRVIGVIPKGATHRFWQSALAGAEATALERGATILWKAPQKESDFASQIAVVEDLIHRKVDGLMVAPTHAEALVPVMKRATAAGIPLVLFDSGADTEDYVSFVATDNYQGGQVAARELGRLLSGRGEIVMIKTQAGSASTEARERGFRETLARELPGVRIVAEQFGLALQERSLAVATDLLTAHPNLTGVFASCEPGTKGAMLAVKSRGLTGRVHVVGFDTSDDLVRGIKEGVLAGLVVQNPYRMGKEGVAAVLDKIEGRTPLRRIDTGVTLVTRANLSESAVVELLKERR